MDSIGIAEFRSSLKECFNKALAGNPVIIERGGVRYTLVCEVVAFQKPRGASAATAVKVDKLLREPEFRIDATRGTAVATIIPTTSVKNKYPDTKITPTKLINGVCRIHGLPLDDRGRCLQKGCKYA